MQSKQQRVLHKHEAGQSPTLMAGLPKSSNSPFAALLCPPPQDSAIDHFVIAFAINHRIAVTMFFKGLALTALAGAAWAAPDLLTLLNSTEGVSNITAILSNFPDFVQAISGLTNITFLAPSDKGIAALENSTRWQTLENAGDDYVLNLLYYHVLNGSYDNITDYGMIPTLLTSSGYANVTGGQVVGAYYDDDDDVVGFYSGLDIDPEGPNKPIPFSGGVVYVIDGVLNLPVSISETVIGEFNGTSFIDALNKTGLTEEVEPLHDVTYFVPVNDGFTAVEEALADLSFEELTEVLKYHVVPGTIGYYDTLENGTALTTLEGQNLTVFITDAGDMFINGAGIVYVDLIIANGVAHLIDNVINPNATVTAPVNGTEDGTPEFAVATSTGSAAATTVATTTYSGLAAPMKTGAVGAAALFGGAALAFNL